MDGDGRGGRVSDTQLQPHPFTGVIFGHDLDPTDTCTYGVYAKDKRLP